MEAEKLKPAIEAILFACGTPAELTKIAQALEIKEEKAEELLKSLMEDYSSRKSGIKIVRLGKSWLYNATIAENIAYGKPDATPDEIREAAKKSYIDGYIRRLPDGYDTIITEDGMNLSQGQRQLMCIARVMLCDPPMLILDEATSSIDTRTEIRVQQAFNAMMKGRTSFIVAHRLSTIKEADIILVMKDGHIIEQGNHEELLAKGGFYTTLYNSQFARSEGA